MVDYTNSDGFVTDDQGRRQYANRDDAALIEGTEIDATDHNEVRNELVYLVSQSGLTPSNEDLTQVYAAVQKLVAVGASEAAVGFTPVEQGGVTGLTSDKINIGNSTNGLAAYMAGTYYGVLATQAWATGKFVANNGGTNGGIVSATIDGGTKTPSFQDGSGTWTQVASYSGLQAEISRATTVESNLQTSIGQKVDKSGDTMTGPLTVKSFSGITASGAPGSANTGDYINYPAFISSSEGRGGTAWLQLQEHVGTNFTLLMGVASGGNSRYFGIPQGARANDSAYGEVAYTSDLSSYVPSATYASDFATTDTRIINLPYGHIIQAFTFTITTAAQYVAFPVSFSNPPMSVVLCQTSGDLDVGAVNWTSTGFTTRSFPGDLNQVISVIAIGPR